jgi:arylsulfatase A-like enzyme
MDTTVSGPRARRSRSSIVLSPKAAILLAIWFGLCGGYLDLALMTYKKYFWYPEGYFWSGKDFPWSVPLGHVVLLFIPGLLVAAVNRRRTGLESARAASWLFATLAFWAALLRMPLYGMCSLLLAAGLGKLAGDAFAARGCHPRMVRYSFAALLTPLILFAVLSSGRTALQEQRALTRLPKARPGTRNVVLIVWDTVRAYSLGLYGYSRDTTPNLSRWARRGVRYDLAVAPAPWTYPSHSSFFTGLWPYQLNSQWKYTLDAASPTLAEFLAARGYQTAGFSANTNCCSYETKLDRGFIHFEDYTLSMRSVLSRTVPGSWIQKYFISPGDFRAHKWIRFQSRDAQELSNSFLDWLRHRRPDRPFFAFLNYFDAHEPYIPPPRYAGRFGIKPEGPRDYHVLLDYEQTDKDAMGERDILMARDCYDDCIAFLDDQTGRLLEELRSQGLLENTLVIITSDHGEAFGDHRIFGHANSLYLDEIAVPLVILAPSAPAGRIVADPVSLRDLPATVVEQLGLAGGSPLPGCSLAAYWRPAFGGPLPPVSRALSEHANATAFQAQPERGLGRRGFQMSLVAQGHHYVRDGMGTEQLYDLRHDPFEEFNLIGSAVGDQVVDAFRKSLLEALTDERGSTEVENAYLKAYRQWLSARVHGSAPSRDRSTALGGLSVRKRHWRDEISDSSRRALPAVSLRDAPPLGKGGTRGVESEPGAIMQGRIP